MTTRHRHMIRYWNRPEATKKELLADGWLCTGDIARIGTCARACVRVRVCACVRACDKERTHEKRMHNGMLTEVILGPGPDADDEGFIYIMDRAKDLIIRGSVRPAS